MRLLQVSPQPGVQADLNPDLRKRRKHFLHKSEAYPILYHQTDPFEGQVKVGTSTSFLEDPAPVHKGMLWLLNLEQMFTQGHFLNLSYLTFQFRLCCIKTLKTLKFPNFKMQKQKQKH